MGIRPSKTCMRTDSVDQSAYDESEYTSLTAMSPTYPSEAAKRWPPPVSTPITGDKLDRVGKMLGV